MPALIKAEREAGESPARSRHCVGERLAEATVFQVRGRWEGAGLQRT